MAMWLLYVCVCAWLSSMCYIIMPHVHMYIIAFYMYMYICMCVQICMFIYNHVKPHSTHMATHYNYIPHARRYKYIPYVPYVWPCGYILRAWPTNSTYPARLTMFYIYGHIPHAAHITCTCIFAEYAVHVYICRMRFSVAIYVELSNMFMHEDRSYVVNRT